MQLPKLENDIIMYFKQAGVGYFTNIIINRYMPGCSMARHNDKNVEVHPFQGLSIFGDFNGGELHIYSGPTSTIVQGCGNFIMNANIDHEVKTVTCGTRFSVISYCKHLGPKTPLLNIDAVQQKGYPLPTMPSTSLASISVAQDLPNFAPLVVHVPPTSLVVHRFWYSPDGTTLPPSFKEAETWLDYHHVIYTNIALEKWTSFNAPKTIVPFQTTCTLHPCLIKDAFQFSLPSLCATPALYADWDFILQNPSLMPDEPTILISEHVKVSSAQSPKDVLRTGVRLHLGLCKFQPNDPIAFEIHQALLAHQKKLQGIHHGHPLWMSNTKIAQAIVIKHNLKVHDPLVFNPFPLWMCKPHFGKLHYGVMMPSIADVLTHSVTVNMWCGHEKFAMAQVLEAITIDRQVPMPRFASSRPPMSSFTSSLPSTIAIEAMDIPVPDDGTSLTTYYYYSFCICPIQMNYD